MDEKTLTIIIVAILAFIFVGFGIIINFILPIMRKNTGRKRRKFFRK